MTEHHDHDTVVVSDGGSSTATILGVLLIVVLLLAVWFFTLGPGAGSGGTTDQGGTDTNPLPSISIPSQPASS